MTVEAHCFVKVPLSFRSVTGSSLLLEGPGRARTRERFVGVAGIIARASRQLRLGDAAALLFFESAAPLSGFVGGAAAGALLEHVWGLASMLVPAALLIAFAGLHLARPDTAEP